MNRIDTARIYQLRQGGSLGQHIAPGSGIVGKPNPDGLALIYFEGNLLDTPALRSHEGRIECAARRLFEDIPTTALLYVDPQVVEESLLEIGEVRWDPEAEACRIAIDPSRMDPLADQFR
ncbi:MAG: hypothetical protein IPM03_16575 [Sulfuritalea sp.]|nr:hypothetical protein [Sulfuritalea sp.]